MRLPMGGCLPTGQEPRVSPARQALRTASKCKLSNQTFGHHASELEGKAAFIDRHIAELKHLSELSESPVAAPPSATVMPLAATALGAHRRNRCGIGAIGCAGCGRRASIALRWGRERERVSRTGVEHITSSRELVMAGWVWSARGLTASFGSLAPAAFAPSEPLSTSCGPWGRERVAGWSAAWTCVGGLLPRDGRSLRRSARTHLAFGCACRFTHCRIAQ